MITNNKICPHCYSDITNYVKVSYSSNKFSIVCPHCKKRMYRDKLGYYHKRGYIMAISAFFGILIIIVILKCMKIL